MACFPERHDVAGTHTALEKADQRRKRTYFAGVREHEVYAKGPGIIKLRLAMFVRRCLSCGLCSHIKNVLVIKSGSKY